MKTFLFTFITCILFFACSNDSENNNEEGKSPSKTLVSYQGVWEGEANDTSFVAISPNGFVSYYFKDRAMGQGYGYLKNDTIFVQNEQTGLSDYIIIKEGYNNIYFTGCISSRNYHGAYIYSGGVFLKTNETITSFSGDMWIPDLWFGNTASYTWSQWRIQITSNNSALHFRYHKTDGITKQEGLYCVQRYYKNRIKFLYSRFTKDVKDKNEVVIFSFDPNEEEKVIRNNKGLIYL